jgi:hypothetical protein
MERAANKSMMVGPKSRRTTVNRVWLAVNRRMEGDRQSLEMVIRGMAASIGRAATWIGRCQDGGAR